MTPQPKANLNIDEPEALDDPVEQKDSPIKIRGPSIKSESGESEFILEIHGNEFAEQI